MSDLLELLKDFEELSEKYRVTKVEDEPHKWPSSPYFYDGGVSTSGHSSASVWVNKYKTEVVPLIYGYERYVWKDTVEDDN